jgi:hypothetical protein
VRTEERSVFVGHIGAGLALKRVAPRANLGVLLLGALFADVLLWVLVLAGFESVVVPADFRTVHYFTFVFPYSHSLVATLVWTSLAGAAVWLLLAPGFPRRGLVALAIALAVLSHFALDLVVHVPDLPVASDQSPKLGFGLWRSMPVALAVELLLAAAALVVYLRAVPLSRGRAALVIGLVVVTGALTALGPYASAEPPPAAAIAGSSLVTLTLVVLLGFWVEGRVGVAGRKPG